jgi:hypothetical protein
MCEIPQERVSLGIDCLERLSSKIFRFHHWTLKEQLAGLHMRWR